MTGKLEFQLPEEEREFEQALKAGKLVCVITETWEHLRRQLKGELSEETRLVLEKLNQELYDVANQLDVCGLLE